MTGRAAEGESGRGDGPTSQMLRKDEAP